MHKPCLTVGALLVSLVSMAALGAPALAQAKPNILFIMSDDVGVDNVSAYSHGLVGYQTPNLDRIANEDLAFQAQSYHCDFTSISSVPSEAPARKSSRLNS